MKIKAMAVLFIMLLSIFPASAWETNQIYTAAETTHTQSTSYVLAREHTHTIGADESLTLYNVAFEAQTTSSTHSGYYKINYQINGGAEVSLKGETYVSFRETTVVTTNNFNIAANKGDTIKIKIYIRRGNESPAKYIWIEDVYTKCYIIQYPPEVSATTNTAEGAHTRSVHFNLVGIGTPAYTLYIDDISVKTGAATWGDNVISLDGLGISQGAHTWYIEASSTQIGQYVYDSTPEQTLTYDTIIPAVTHYFRDPAFVNVVQGNTVNIYMQWSDANINYVEWWVNTGSGYQKLETVPTWTLNENSGWVNKTINTAGQVGKTITYKQVCYDWTGNSYTYSGSFVVILDALLIYCYDETTGDAVTPAYIRFYNDELSRTATINGTGVGTVSYTGLSNNEKYVVSVTALDYYGRTAITEVNLSSLSRLNVFLVNASETSALYEKITITDNYRQYENSEYIIRLDKPIGDSVYTVYQSYFDYSGAASTYLIADDAYILYIITPGSTTNYGWMTPDADGLLEITLNKLTLNDYYTEWLRIAYSGDDSQISLNYESDKPVTYANFTISAGGNVIYSASSETDEGSFIYGLSSNQTYITRLNVTTEDGTTYERTWINELTDNSMSIFPGSYPQWLKDTLITVLAILCMLAFSNYRADVGAVLAASLVGYSWYVGEYTANPIIISILFLIAGVELLRAHKKEEKTA